MERSRDIFEEVKIQHTTAETAEAVRALADYIRQIQCMRGIWKLHLRRLCLEVEGRRAEVTDLCRTLAEEDAPQEAAKAETERLWTDDSPLMALTKHMEHMEHMEQGGTIRFLADFYLTAEDTVSYGIDYWRGFLEMHDTSTVRKLVSYRCMDYDELGSEYFLGCYDGSGGRMIPLRAGKRSLPAVSAWSTKEFWIFAHPEGVSELDSAAVERAETLGRCFQERYMKGQGRLSASPQSFFLIGPMTIPADRMEEVFREAELIRQCFTQAGVHTETEGTFAPDRAHGNEAFVLVHVCRHHALDAEYCTF